MFTIVLLSLAGFAAGCLNAVAGGGTFLTFPALVYLGFPPVAANATATVAALPGYGGSAYAYRQDMASEGTLRMPALVVTAAAGGVAGALLLLVTPSEVFGGLVPWLLLVSTVLFAMGPKLMRELNRRGAGQAGPLLSGATIFAVSVYGGYFNGGLGIMLLASFGLLGHVNLHGMNGLKNVLSALLSLVSATTFAAAGLIYWREAVIMALAAATGGYVGAWLVRRMTRTGPIRAFIAAVGATMTVIFFAT